MKPTIIVSFSGGKTSAYMAYKIKNELSKHFNIVFLFANTGQEHEKTLEFVDRCDKEWGLNVIWLEAKINKGRKGTTYKVVNFDTASRDGQPFIEVCAKYGLPNKTYLHCTRELKLNPMLAYRKSEVGYAYFAVGIRLDEFDRIANNHQEIGIIYPLIDKWPTRKVNILEFWDKQDFCLDLPDHLGNCLWCYKKSDAKLAKVIEYDETIFRFPAYLENEFSEVQSKSEEYKRKIFRGNRSTKELIETVDISNTESNGCSEQCDAFGY